MDKLTQDDLRIGGRMIGMRELVFKPAQRWLIEDHFFDRSLSVIYGPPGVKKSFLALEVAMSIVSGIPFLGRFPVRRGSVLYLAAEGLAGVRSRLLAWYMAHQTESGLMDNLRLLGVALDLLQRGDVDALTAAVDDWGQKPDLIIIDTLARFMAGDENDAEDMGEFLRSCGHLQDRLDCAVLILHHPGKDSSRGERGHSNLPGAVDTRIRMESLYGTSQINFEKQKDCVPLKPYLVSSKIVEIMGERSNLVLEYGTGAKQDRNQADEVVIEDSLWNDDPPRPARSSPGTPRKRVAPRT